MFHRTKTGSNKNGTDMFAMWNIFRYEHGMNRYTERKTVQQVIALERGKPQGFKLPAEPTTN